MYVRHTNTTIVLYYLLSVYYFFNTVSPVLQWESQKEVVSYIISVSYISIILHYKKPTLLVFGSFYTISDILCTIIIVFVCTTLVVSVGLLGRSFFESQKVVTNKQIFFVLFWLLSYIVGLTSYPSCVQDTARHCVEHRRHVYCLCATTL